MRIVMTGSGGLIGNSLGRQLLDEGHTIRPLRHGKEFDPAAGRIEATALSGAEAVIHLAGENIAAGRWSAARKERIRSSRVEGTRLLVEALRELDQRPAVLISASAVGYFGDRGEDEVSEESPPGTGFLAEVCQAWESEAQAAAGSGIRVVLPRFGAVLARGGGVLDRVLLPFRLGLGGRLGSGRQAFPWIGLTDAVAILRTCLHDEHLEGPVNCVSPRPATNGEFTRALGRVLHRPTLIPIPGFALRLLFGEMAEELLLAGARATPKKLTDLGHTFLHPELEDALRHELDPT